MKKVVLASKSPRRKEILEDAGVKFKIVVSDADESIVPKCVAPELYVSELALLKATHTARQLHGDYLVIGSDTIVEYEGRFLGKPKTEDEAFSIIKSLSGNEHRVYSGICVFDTKTGRAETDFECTKVYFKTLSDLQIREYILTDEPYDKAGGYAIQGVSGAFVERIDGDYYNVVGLPLDKLIKLMKDKFDFDLITKK